MLPGLQIRCMPWFWNPERKTTVDHPILCSCHGKKPAHRKTLHIRDMVLVKRFSMMLVNTPDERIFWFMVNHIFINGSRVTAILFAKIAFEHDQFLLSRKSSEDAKSYFVGTLNKSSASKSLICLFYSLWQVIRAHL